MQDGSGRWRSQASPLPLLSGLNRISAKPLAVRLRYDIRTQARSVPDMGEITELLHKWREGDREAENELFALVLPDLRRLAHYLMKGERKDHTLQPTELVDQIYFRLVSAKDRDWHNRQHFFAIAGRAMRRYLIDHARGRPNAEFVAIEGMENLIPGDSAKGELGNHR